MRSTRKKRKKGGRKKNCRYLQGGVQSPQTARVVNPTIKTLTKAKKIGECMDLAQAHRALPSRRDFDKASKNAQEKYARCLHNDVEKGGCGVVRYKDVVIIYSFQLKEKKISHAGADV